MAGALGSLEDRLDRGLARREVGGEAALVADRGREPALVEHASKCVVDLGADPECLGERRRAGRDEHELLQIDRIGSVHAAVDHVHHRHGERVPSFASEVPEERDPGVRCAGLCCGERGPEDRVRTESALVRGAVERDQRGIEPCLVGRVEAGEACGDLAVHIGNRVRDALAAEGRSAVAQLDRLVHAGRGARGNRRAAERAGLEPNVDLDGRIAARIEHPPAVNLGDPAQRSASFACS